MTRKEEKESEKRNTLQIAKKFTCEAFEAFRTAGSVNPEENKYIRATLIAAFREAARMVGSIENQKQLDEIVV